MKVIKKLKSFKYLDCLVLQHSHLGSQIPDIIEIRKATQEACRFYSEMCGVVESTVLILFIMYK